MNRRMPFHKTTGKIAEWLVQEAKKEEGLEKDVEVVTRQSVVQLLSTPQRRVRDNPRPTSNWIEDRFSAVTTGATPSKGIRCAVRGELNDAQKLFSNRLNQCAGTIFPAVIGKNGKRLHKCRVCGSDTRYYSSGCKTWYYFLSNDAKVHKRILNNHANVAFLNGVRPPPLLNLRSIEATGEIEGVSIQVLNTCWHIQHQSAVAASRRRSLSLLSTATVDGNVSTCTIRALPFLFTAYLLVERESSSANTSITSAIFYGYSWVVTLHRIV